MENDKAASQKDDTNNSADARKNVAPSDAKPYSQTTTEDAQRKQHSAEDEFDEFMSKAAVILLAKLKRATLKEIIEVVSAVIIAGATVVGATIAWQNYQEIKRNDQQTSPLVTYAGQQAAAAEKFRIASEGINGGVGKAITKLDSQAKATQSAATTAREALIGGQGALVSFRGIVDGNKVVQGGKTAGIELVMPWINSGSTPTRRAFSGVNFDMTEGAVMDENFNFHDRALIQQRQFAIAPRGAANATETVPIQHFQFAKTGNFHLYVWGWITYHDIFKGTPTHLSEFCDELANVQSSKDDMTDASSEIKWNSLLCPVPHNCADEECSDYKEKTKGK